MTVDLSFRPLSYWPESLDQEKLLGRIKGMARRVEARRILNNEGFRGLTQFLGRDELSDQERGVEQDPSEFNGWGIFTWPR